MGNKGTKAGVKLKDKEVKFLTNESGMSKKEIEKIFTLFNENNPEQKLDKQMFKTLYAKLRPEPEMEQISMRIFNAFDRDKNGTVNFNEFLVKFSRFFNKKLYIL